MTLSRMTCITVFAFMVFGHAHAQDQAADASAATDQPAELDRLFDELAVAEEGDIPRLERRIAQLWSRSGSDSMDYLLRRGRNAMEEETYDKAVDHFSALVALAPEFAEGWNGRATAHFLAEQYWLSVADIQQVLALEPRHFGALTGLISIFERIGDDAGALRAARAALELHPNLKPAKEAVERLAPKVDGRKI